MTSRRSLSGVSRVADATCTNEDIKRVVSAKAAQVTSVVTDIMGSNMECALCIIPCGKSRSPLLCLNDCVVNAALPPHRNRKVKRRLCRIVPGAAQPAQTTACNIAETQHQ